MTDCIAKRIEFSKLGRRRLEAQFSDGEVSSDGGLLLLREVDRRLKLSERMAAALADPRDPQRITHPLVDLLRQRVYAIVHGRQEEHFFHGYYDSYCYLPLYVFCGEQLLVAYLRPSKIDESKHAGAILKLLVRRLRKAWPTVRIVLRGDSAFAAEGSWPGASETLSAMWRGWPRTAG